MAKKKESKKKTRTPDYDPTDNGLNQSIGQGYISGPDDICHHNDIDGYGGFDGSSWGNEGPDDVYNGI